MGIQKDTPRQEEKGGKAQEKRNNPSNFANDRKKAATAGRKDGSKSPRSGRPVTSCF